jgi:hypothetical protein
MIIEYGTKKACRMRNTAPPKSAELMFAAGPKDIHDAVHHFSIRYDWATNGVAGFFLW